MDLPDCAPDILFVHRFLMGGTACIRNQGLLLQLLLPFLPGHVGLEGTFFTGDVRRQAIDRLRAYYGDYARFGIAF